MKSKFLILVAATLGVAAFAASEPAHAGTTVNIGQAQQQGTWQWFEDDTNMPMYCLDKDPNGKPFTGFGYFVPAGWNGNVMFFLDGGGFCYDYQSCVANAPLGNNPSADATLFGDLNATPPVHPGPTLGPPIFRTWYNQASFNADTTNTGVLTVNGDFLSKPVLLNGVFDTTNPAANPFTDYMKVFLPYCTGDLHAGWNPDTSSRVTGRRPSGLSFYGLGDSYYTFIEALSAIQSNKGHLPARIILSGGSAGGFGAEMLYGLLREIVGPASSGTSILVLDDAGTPFYSGQSSDGKNWTSQGYFGLPGTSSQTVGSMEEWWFDAWGSFWTGYYPSANLVNGQPIVSSPLGTGHQSFAPLQAIVASNFLTASQPSSYNYGDKFYLIDSTSDWLWSLFLPTYETATTPAGGMPIIDAYEQLVNVLPLNVFFPVTSRNLSNLNPVLKNIAPWYEHHTFVEDNVSSWSIANGSGLSSLWNTFCGTSSGPWAHPCDSRYVNQN
jgi:hypothetical protein